MIVETPVVRWRGPGIERTLGAQTEVYLKLELFQRANSFKARGALTVALNHSPEELANGLTALSSGNHAIAVAQIARMMGISAKVVMLESANPMRRALCEKLGAELIISATGEEGFEMAAEIADREGRVFIHPFEGPLTSLGAATVALELDQQIPDLDAVVVAIGGGGLCSGLGPAIKQFQPSCKVYAVEPEGAPTMFRSFQSGHTERQEVIDTIADSLGPPATEPYSMAMCQQSVDDLVLISDQQMRNAMALLFEEMKLVVEPAGAAATAGICGPLRDRLKGQRIAVMVCGSNIDLESFTRHIKLADKDVSEPPR
jgi:threonine dehydratase